MHPFDTTFFQPTFEAPLFRVVATGVGLLALLAVVFFAIAVCLRIASDRRRTHIQQLERRWQPLLLDILNGPATPPALQNIVDEDDARYFLDYLYRFARQVHGSERKTVRKIAAPFLEEAASSLSHTRAEQRARSLQIVGLLGFYQYTDEIVAALDDPSPLVAMIAARALARREHPEYAEEILRKLHRFEDWSSGFLTSLLANLGPAVAPTLRRTLSDADRTTAVRAIAADGLRELNDPASADTAAAILAGSAPRDLTTASLRLLKQVGRREHLPIVRSLCEDPDAVVRIHAVGALSEIAGTSEEDRLLNATHDPSRWVAYQAIDGLKQSRQLDTLRAMAASSHPRAALAQQALVEEQITMR